MRQLIAALILVLVTSSVSGAQPSEVVVTDRDGALWLVRDGTRYLLVPFEVPSQAITQYPEGAPIQGTQLPPARPVSEPQWREVARWQGITDKNTEPFTIRSDQWRIVYTMVPPTPNVRPQVCISVYRTPNNLVPGAAGCFQQNESNLTHAGPGTYYLRISGVAQSWTVSVEELA